MHRVRVYDIRVYELVLFCPLHNFINGPFILQRVFETCWYTMTFLCLTSSLPHILCAVQLMGVCFLKRDTAQRVVSETQCSAFGNNLRYH